MNARMLLPVAVVAALTAWWLTRSGARRELPEAEPVVAAPTSAPVSAVATEPPSQGTTSQNRPEIGAPKSSPAADLSKPPALATPEPGRPRLQDEAPSIATMNKELDEDPHGTPPSLLEFSGKLGDRVRAAQSPSEGAEVFVELTDCVINPKEATAYNVQAICLLKARDLTLKFPRFKENYDILAGKAKPQALKLIEGIP